MNKFNLNLKNVLLFISVLFLTLYIPLTYTVYSDSWYKFNYNQQDTYQQLGENKTINATNNLINFFLHNKELNGLWNQKEIKHMNDVRNIYDILFILFVLSVISITLLFDKKLIKKYSKINMIVIGSLIIVIPFFSLFWNYIFHPLMFSNNLWIMTSNDISYYLFDIENYTFMFNSVLLVILSGVAINLIIWIKMRKS
jgi:hypothetical protein